MKKKSIASIMDDYDGQCALYTDFTEKIEKLVNDVLKENKARVHSITSRVKGRISLQSKIERSQEKYEKLTDVTDLSGIRIITYFADEVDKVAEIIQKEFNIDQEHSVDKRMLLDPDRFGYLSLHYIAKLSDSRLKLIEYRRFRDCNVEIQIRSILQHTWAEIEHDLGYKSKQAIPKDIRRRFSRLAGLLELADDEFTQIRDSLAEYEVTVPQRIVDTPSSVLIDKASLLAYMKQSPLVAEIDHVISSESKVRLTEDSYYFVSENLDKLQYFGLKTIEDVDMSLRKHQIRVIALAKHWLTKDTEGGTISRGISLFYLGYILALANDSVKEISNYLERFRIVTSEERDSTAKELLSFYRAAIKSQ